MKQSRFNQTRPQPWLLCALVATITFSGPAKAESAKNQTAVALRIEARGYEIGNTATRDPAKAVRLYCEAARLGDVEAQYNLGWMYANGRGVRGLGFVDRQQHLSTIWIYVCDEVKP